MKPVTVRTPHNMIWAHRFHTVEAAWGRICGLKGIENTRRNRNLLTEDGWVVNDTSASRK